MFETLRAISHIKRAATLNDNSEVISQGSFSVTRRLTCTISTLLGNGHDQLLFILAYRLSPTVCKINSPWHQLFRRDAVRQTANTSIHPAPHAKQITNDKAAFLSFM